VVPLATQFKTDEGPEIQQMQSRLSQWGQPMPSMAPGMEMPGMLPDQDLTALQNTQGVDASKRFLTEMIECHQGTIAMAQDEIKSGQYPPAVALAHSIARREQQENTNNRPFRVKSELPRSPAQFASVNSDSALSLRIQGVTTRRVRPSPGIRRRIRQTSHGGPSPRGLTPSGCSPPSFGVARKRTRISAWPSVW